MEIRKLLESLNSTDSWDGIKPLTESSSVDKFESMISDVYGSQVQDDHLEVGKIVGDHCLVYSESDDQYIDVLTTNKVGTPLDCHYDGEVFYASSKADDLRLSEYNSLEELVAGVSGFKSIMDEFNSSK